ncbi:MAG: hypothetical protein L0099_14150, partial [Acidobacteria bacterium]|nr:hypothetical protein [Acidobacteriota bacterium]
GRVLPVNRDLIDQFLKPLGQPGSYGAVDRWVKKYNERQIEDEHFVVKGEGSAFYGFLTVSLNLAVTFTPREGKGETPAEARQAGSRFRQFLKGYQPKDRFIHFTVQPDSLDAFMAARAVAAEMGFGVGWMPLPDKEPLGFSVSGGGIKPREQ